MVDTIIILDTGFSVKYWNQYSLQAFLQEATRDGFFKNHPPEKQKELLELAHQLITAQ